MKKATRTVLWISIPLVLAVAFGGPRLGLFGKREKGPETIQKAAQGPSQGQRPGRTQSGAPLPVTATIAKPSYLTNGIRSAGTLLANEEVDIVSKVSGKVTGVFFKEGSVVKKGDLLVKIYDEDLQAQLKRCFQKSLSVRESCYQRML
jgi:membrane fusion protein (multidrug efflux system)